jgi:hypothetical protein
MARSFLKTSVVVRMIDENLPMMVMGRSIWEMSGLTGEFCIQSRAQLLGGSAVCAYSCFSY